MLTHPPGQTVPSLGSALGQAYDVFICHRGPEVKRSLVGHIKERLQRANLIVFVDYEMCAGVMSWAHVMATLRGARRVLILLTRGFEESPWCLEEARAATARLDTVLPVFVDREASWDEIKLRSAFNSFSAHRDFDELHAAEPVSCLAANMIELWRTALDSLAGISYLTHSSKSGCAILPTNVCCGLAQRHEQAWGLRRLLPAASMRSSWTMCTSTSWRSFNRSCAQRLSTRWSCQMSLKH